MTVNKLIQKMLPFRGNTEIIFTFYCAETNKTYRINPDKILTIYDAREDQVEFYTTNAPDKLR